MKYYKILDRIEYILRTGEFNDSYDIVTYQQIPAGSMLHPFDGDQIIKYEAYTKEVRITHRQRLLKLWEKIRDYSYFECTYDCN